MKSYFSRKTVIITGGTGSLGTALCGKLIDQSVGTLRVLSRDERKHIALKEQFPNTIRCLIGDIRDLNRLKVAFRDVDFVIHTAAMKHVDLSEYNPWECTKTNVLGTQNVIDAAISCGVSKVLFVSSDKAVNPCNIYGASKLMGERLILGAKSYAGDHGPSFAIARFGNFMWSSGSVLEKWLSLFDQGIKKLPLTDPKMTRFWILKHNAAKLCCNFLRAMKGGEIFLPKIARKQLSSLGNELFPGCDYEIIDQRPGEKIHEEMLTHDEAERTYETGDYYYIMPEKKKGALIVDTKEFFKKKYIL